MQNTIRNVLFLVAIGFLIIYFIPGRSLIIEILENSGPGIVIFIIIILYFYKIKKFTKAGGGNWQKNIIGELNKLSGPTSSKKKPQSNILKEFDKFINRSDKS